MYYVYVLIRPDGRPFYVGKGKGNRVHQHETEARTECQCHKCRTIRKIWKSGGNVVKSIVFETRKEEEAYQQEAILIERLGLGSLTNVIPGEQRWHGERGPREYDPLRTHNEQERINGWRRSGLTWRQINDKLERHYQYLYEQVKRQYRTRFMRGFSREEVQRLEILMDTYMIAFNKVAEYGIQGLIEQGRLWEDE